MIGAQRPRLKSLPADISNTDTGDEVIEFCKRFGLVLDDWQQWCVRYMCAERTDGSWSATQSVLLVPRQSGKSKILEAIEMAALFLWDQQHIIYSAHLGKTATDHMRRIRNHIYSTPDFKRQARVLTGKGDERIERNDTGAILEFITRGKKSSRGGSPNLVIFDEAMFLTDEQIEAMLPALSAQSMNEDVAAQMIYASSAPIAESQVLHRLRKRALNSSPSRMFFAEWSAEPDCDPADRINWYLANPGMGIRISEEWVADNEFGTLSPQGFAVERLGIPEEPDGIDGVVIDPVQWLAITDSTSVAQDPVVFAVDTSKDREWSAIAVAANRAGGGQHIEILDHRPSVPWLVAELIRLRGAWPGSAIVVDPASPAWSIVPELAAAGIEVTKVTAQSLAAACGAFLDAVTGYAAEDGTRVVPTLHYRPDVDEHPEHAAAMVAAVFAARKRSVGDGWAWSRKDSQSDITPLVAATLAFGALPAAANQEHTSSPVGGLADFLED